VEPSQRYTTQESFTITVVEEDEGLPAVADGEVTEPPTDTIEEPPADDGEEAEPPTNSTGGQ
jgi:hypothetical protein